MSTNSPADLQRIYEQRFGRDLEYRQQVWQVLVSQVFQRFAAPNAAVLDLGCGYGEFIRHIRCGRKFAMDLNPDAPRRAGPGVECFVQDCSAPWPLPDGALDLVFTSNFFEHLPDKAALGRTLDEACRCLRPGGRLVAMGPNIRYSPVRIGISGTITSANRIITQGGSRKSRLSHRSLPCQVSAIYDGGRPALSAVVSSPLPCLHSGLAGFRQTVSGGSAKNPIRPSAGSIRKPSVIQ